MAKYFNKKLYLQIGIGCNLGTLVVSGGFWGCSDMWQPLMYISPVLKSSKLEFDNYQSIFVWHFAYQSIPTTNVLAKYRSFLWNWTPSHIQRIYKGQNSENPLRAITFDWSVLRTWDQRLWAAFLMLFSGIPHLPTLRDTWHVTYVTHVTHVTWHMWHTRRDKR